MEIQLPNRGTVGVIDILNYELIRTIARSTPECEFFIQQEIEAKEPTTVDNVLFYPFVNQNLIVIKGIARGSDGTPAKFTLSCNSSSCRIANKNYFFNYAIKEWEQVTTITKSEIDANNKKYNAYKNTIESNQKNIQELQNQNQSFRKEIDDLKNQNQSLKTNLEQLQTRIKNLENKQQAK